MSSRRWKLKQSQTGARNKKHFLIARVISKLNKDFQAVCYHAPLSFEIKMQRMQELSQKCGLGTSMGEALRLVGDQMK